MFLGSFRPLRANPQATLAHCLPRVLWGALFAPLAPAILVLQPVQLTNLVADLYGLAFGDGTKDGELRHPCSLHDFRASPVKV